MQQAPPFELTDQEATDIATSVASMIDRICDGHAETLCFEFQRTDSRGRRLTIALTLDPELQLGDYVKRYNTFKRLKAAQQQNPEEPECPSGQTTN